MAAPVRYRKNPHTAGRLIDGLAFVVTPGDSRLHQLNATGTLLWRMSGEDGGVAAEEAAAALVEHFEVDLDTARTDVERCLAEFVEREILVAAG